MKTLLCLASERGAATKSDALIQVGNSEGLSCKYTLQMEARLQGRDFLQMGENINRKSMQSNIMEKLLAISLNVAMSLFWRRRDS